MENVVKATCVLVNFLCVETNAMAHYCPAGFADFCDRLGNVCEGSWQQEPAVAAAMFPLQGAKAHKLQLLWAQTLSFYFFHVKARFHSSGGCLEHVGRNNSTLFSAHVQKLHTFYGVSSSSALLQKPVL